MSDQTEAFARQVAGSVPALGDLLAEHLEDNNGVLLPHVYFGAVSQWVDDELTTHPESTSARRVLEQIDAASATGGDDVRELINVSFLENLEDGSPVLDQLTPRLRELRAEVRQP